MEFVTLRNGVQMPMVGFGTYPLKGKQLENLLITASHSGYQLIDTATAYSNEQDIRNVINDSNRDSFFITSKVGSIVLKGRRKYLWLNKKSLTKAFEDSCEKLGVHYIDAYLLHQPFEGCVRHYKELMNLYNQGRVRVIGVSNFNEEELQQLYDQCGEYPMINQTEISPFNTQDDLVNFCKSHNIVVEAYSPFGRGKLVQSLLSNEILKSMANKYKRTVGQIVLRWIVQRGIVVIARSTNEERIAENINVFDFSLSEEDMYKISSLNSNIVYGINQVNKKTVKL